jgi:hypothetical protein
MKSAIAFRFSVEASKLGFYYLWTFTFREALPVPEARRLWSAGLRELRRSVGFLGLRVFEMHKEHGLHVHALTTKFFNVRGIRHIWQGGSTCFKGGRVNVVTIPKSDGHYLGKYLSKQRRPDCFKGVRLWASFGGFPSEKVKDIVCDSPFTRVYHMLKAAFAEFASLPFAQRAQAVSNVRHNRPWNSWMGISLAPAP